MSSRKSETIIGAVVAALLVVFVVFLAVDRVWANAAWMFARGQWWWIAPFVLMFGVAGAGLWATEKRENAETNARNLRRDLGWKVRNARMNGGDFDQIERDVEKAATVHDEEAERMSRIVVTAGIAVVVLVVGMGWLGAVHGYSSSRHYLESVSVVDTGSPTYDERAAFTVAERQAAANQGLLGSIVDTTYLASDDDYASLVEKPGSFNILAGYTGVIVQHLELTGTATRDGSCEFSTVADDRIGGIWHHSLERRIIKERFGVNIITGDVYGYCDGETPVVVVPLTKWVGAFPVTLVPAGVALYDGATGEVTVVDEVNAGDIPGPAFPLSLAERMRGATAATGTWFETVTGRVGYADTSSDEADPNADNRSEMLLPVSGSDMADYVTPLTLRGRGSSIGAVSHVAANTVTAGELNELVIHRLPEPRKANSGVVDDIKSEFGDLPNWASGMTVFEITPQSPDRWVASLGLQQNVSYRALIDEDGGICLYRADGSFIRCGRVTDTDGYGPGVQIAPDTDDPYPIPGGGVPADSDVTALTDDELADLAERVNTEVYRRLTAAD